MLWRSVYMFFITGMFVFLPVCLYVTSRTCSSKTTKHNHDANDVARYSFSEIKDLKHIKIWSPNRGSTYRWGNSNVTELSKSCNRVTNDGCDMSGGFSCLRKCSGQEPRSHGVQWVSWPSHLLVRGPHAAFDPLHFVSHSDFDIHFSLPSAPSGSGVIDPPKYSQQFYKLQQHGWWF